MWVIVVCLVLVLAGLLAIIRWGGLAVQLPPTPAEEDTVPAGRPPVGLVVRRYLWYLTLAISAGVGAGILAAGAGGRLVMRLLVVTAGPDAQGRITEADQVVGRIGLDGTLGFIVFTGLFFGAASGAAYLLVRRWLPGGPPRRRRRRRRPLSRGSYRLGGRGVLARVGWPWGRKATSAV
ncbi:MAG TPA: hypothetical protein VFC13_09440, partial [Actinomycetes bacterium]|nr:hypothetical protein [Actinomycetes bacterium]